MQKQKRNSIFDSKLLYFIVALFASFALWLYVSSVEKVEIEETFSNIPIEFTGEQTIRETRDLVVTQVSDNIVSVKLRGQRSVISKLKDSADELTAVIDISGITEPVNNRTGFTLSLPEGIESTDVTIVSRTPSVIEYYIDKQSTRTIDVVGKFVGSVAEGYIVSSLVIDPLTVRISGPEKVIEQVDHAYVEINRSDIDASLQFSTEYILLDADGNEIDDDSIVLETETVNVSLPVKATKEVALSVDIISGGGATSQNAIIDIEPSAITIVGDAEILDGINRITLGQIDLSDVDRAFEQTYQIVLDNGIENQSGATEALVTVEIRGLETKDITITNFECTGVPDGYAADIFTKSLTVKVRAPEEVIDDISATNIRAVADLTNFADTVGDMTVPVKIYIAGHSDAGVIGDYTIFVSLTEGADEEKNP